MNCFAKMLLFAVIAIAVFGVIGMETAEARCHGYNGWYSAPTCYTGGYYARRSCYRYVPNYCGYGYGGYGSGGYGSGGYGFGYGGW